LFSENVFEKLHLQKPLLTTKGGNFFRGSFSLAKGKAFKKGGESFKT
jgi:hypothetical protein